MHVSRQVCPSHVYIWARSHLHFSAHVCLWYDLCVCVWVCLVCVRLRGRACMRGQVQVQVVADSVEDLLEVYVRQKEGRGQVISLSLPLSPPLSPQPPSPPPPPPPFPSLLSPPRFSRMPLER